MSDAEEQQSRTLLDERLQAAIKSDDTLILRNLATALVAMGGPRHMELLASLISRLLRDAKDAGTDRRYLDLLTHVRLETRRLTEEDGASLRAQLGQTEQSTAAFSILGSTSGMEESAWNYWRGIRSGWPRPGLARLALSTATGAAAGAGAIWLILLLIAVWRGFLRDASQWPGLDLFLSSILLSVISVTIAASTVTTGGLSPARPWLRSAEALLFGLFAATLICGLTFLMPSSSSLRSLAMPSSNLPFGSGPMFAASIAVLALFGTAARALTRYLAEHSSREAASGSAWSAGSLVAGFATLSIYAILPVAGTAADSLTGLWLITVSMVFAAAHAVSLVDEHPAEIAAALNGPIRYAKRLPFLGAALFLATILILPLRSGPGASDVTIRRVPIPLEASFDATPPEQYDVVLTPLTSEARTATMRINGGRLTESQGSNAALYGSPPIAIVEATAGRLDICFLAQRPDAPLGQTLPPCDPGPLWWLRAVLGRNTVSSGSAATLYFARAGHLIRTVPADKLPGFRQFDINAPAVLSALYQGPPGWDAVIMVEQLVGAQWQLVGRGDDPPELRAVLLRPGRYRICVRGFGDPRSCEPGTPERIGSMLYSALPLTLMDPEMRAEMLRARPVDGFAENSLLENSVLAR